MVELEKGSVWLRYAFLLPGSKTGGLATSKVRRKTSTSAAFKFTNTTLGGNYAMNNPPQFTHYADIRHPGLGRSDEQWREGMGRYYSEALDDTKQIVHFSFGVPRFSSWTNFFTNFYDSGAALLANTGRVSGAWYQLGLAGGFVVSLPLQPFILGFSATAKVYNFLAKNQPSKWYYFSPTMHSYWSAVNVIANDLAINMGIIPRVFGQAQNELQDDNRQKTDPTLDSQTSYNTYLHRNMPSVFRKDGGIDVMSLARRTERMSYTVRESMKAIGESATNIQEYRNQVLQKLQSAPPEDKDPYKKYAGNRKGPNGEVLEGGFVDYFLDYVNGTGVKTTESGQVREGSSVDDVDKTSRFSSWSDLSGVYEFITASQRDGSQFVSFRVNHTGQVSESFSNSVRDSDIAQELNSKVSQGRQAAFNFRGAAGSIPGMDAVAGALTGLVTGALDSVHLGGLATLTGTAFIDVPKVWDSSTANLPRADYTIPLYSPYGNKLSRYMNLMLPIAMVMAGGLPLSAGRSSYTSPFICQVYHQGRVQCQLGMIDAITINRGTGNVGWNAEHEMLGAEITVSVIDLSSIMHIPIKGGFSNNNIIGDAVRAVAMGTGDAIGGQQGAAIGAAFTDASVWDESSLYSDYMAVLSSMSLADSYYIGNRLNLNLTRSVRKFESWRSPSNFMSWVLDGQPARVLSAFSNYSDRI